MSSLRVDLYKLIGDHTLKSVHQELMTIMRQEYEFLHQFYSNATSSPELPEKKNTKNTKIKGGAEETSRQLFKTDISANSISPETSCNQKNTPPISGDQKPTPPETPIQSENTLLVSAEQKTIAPETSGDQKKVQVITGEKKNYLSREEEKEKKKEHDLKVKVKREELLSKSVVPEQMLTKEKMEGWISSGWTYWKIAEETGCADTYVSSMAKGFGLKRMPGNNVYVKRVA